MPEIQVLQNISAISRNAAEKFIKIGNKAVKENGKFTVALAGGSTPKSLCRLLSTDEFASKINWQKVFFFFGDERNVLPDDKQSNFRMARENLLKPLRISDNNFFRWQTELVDAEKIAADYERTIKEFFILKNKAFASATDSDTLPRFDLILLGMGDDGHTASLFPFTKALSETERIVVANRVEKLKADRLTFTFPAINNAANVVFLIGGAEKADTLRKVLEGKRDLERFPAQNVILKTGNLFWLVEEKAARFLSE